MQVPKKLQYITNSRAALSIFRFLACMLGVEKLPKNETLKIVTLLTIARERAGDHIATGVLTGEKRLPPL